MASSAVASHPRRYSAEEILTLRTSLPVVNCVVEKLNKHPDIAEIFRIPDEALNNPDRYICQSRALVDATNRRKVWQLGTRRTEVSTDTSDEQMVSSLRLSSYSRPQWHFRRRENSNCSSEPQPAPSGIASQQSENFQRFYRAVVSPTHIRVTAGGRIVPNTRVTAPPQFNWNPEKCLFEPRRSLTDEIDVEQPNIASPLPPVPLPNYNPLSQNVSLAQATMAAHSLSIARPSSESIQAVRESSSNPLLVPVAQQSIKISPPSQFDNSRPFMFNGQLVYPVPNGFQPPPNSTPVPISVLGDPNLAHHGSSMGGFHAPPFPIPMPLGGFAGPFIVPPGPAGHYPMMTPNGMSPMDGAFLPSPFMPPSAPSMVSLPELTRFQIRGFRNQVKIIDNQLASRQNLPDEPSLQRQRTELMIFVEKMESMLQSQLGQVGNDPTIIAPNASTGVTASDPVGLGSAKISLDAHQDEGSKSHESTGHKPMSMLLSPVKSRGKEPTDDESEVASPAVVPPIPLFVSGPQSTGPQSKPENGHSQGGNLDLKPLKKSESIVKTKLTAAAAKAPPFQPRAHAIAQRSISDQNSDGSAQISTSSVSSSFQRQDQLVPYHANPRREAVSSSDSGYFHAGPAHASLSRAHTMQAPHLSDSVYTGYLQRSSSTHAMPAFQRAATYDAGSHSSFIPHNAVPYLVGSLPMGMHISEVQGPDIKYPRSLTDEELRARHLYWGDAPRSATKGSGLPKFDGKDFYPPSPTKQTAMPALNGNGSRPNDSALPNFERLFEDPGKPAFQTPPSRSRTRSGQHSMHTPTQAFLEKDINVYESPSPHPAVYKFESRLSTDCSPAKDADAKTLPRKESQKAISKHSKSDFSNLFASPSVSYRPQHSTGHQVSDIAQPTTSTSNVLTRSVLAVEHVDSSTDSWVAPYPGAQRKPEDVDDVATIKQSEHDSPSDASTVETCLTSKGTEGIQKAVNGINAAERNNNTQNDQHTMFLRDMLRNAASKSAPTLSGAISSATAQGYLPQYRGSAAASLAPAMLTVNSLDHEDETTSMKALQGRIAVENAIKASMESVVPLKAENFLPENRPTNRDRPHRPILASVDTLRVDGYHRYSSHKADDDKTVLDSAWNSHTAAKGPVTGDW